MNEYRFTFTGKILYSTRILIYFSKYTESIEGEMQFNLNIYFFVSVWTVTVNVLLNAVFLFVCLLF